LKDAFVLLQKMHDDELQKMYGDEQ